MQQQENMTEWQRSLEAQWGWIAFRGVLAVLFAIIAFFYPIATIITLAMFWGIFAVMEGITALVTGWRMHKQGNKAWPYFLFGAIGIIAGLLAFVWPGLTSMVLVFMIGIWAIFGGMSEIIMSVGVRKQVDRWWILLLSGIISVLFGMFILYAPLEGMLTIIWVLAGFTLAIGIISIILAVQLKRGKFRGVDQSL